MERKLEMCMEIVAMQLIYSGKIKNIDSEPGKRMG